MKNDILVTMNGIAIITRDDLEKEKKRICDNNPKFEQALPLMDSVELNRCLLEGLIFINIVKKYIAEHNLDQLEEYKTELELHQGEENLVNANFFYNQFPVAVDDSEIKHFYEENKERLFFRRSEDETNLHESKYLDYETIKDEIKKVLKIEKQRKLVDQEIDKLKEIYKIEFVSFDPFFA